MVGMRHWRSEECFKRWSRAGPAARTDKLEIILERLNSANEIKDMNYPGSNLHKLTGDKKGLYAVKVSDRVIGEYFLNSSMETLILCLYRKHRV